MLAPDAQLQSRVRLTRRLSCGAREPWVMKGKLAARPLHAAVRRVFAANTESLRKFHNASQPRIEILITEGFAESSEGRLPCAVTRRQLINFPLVM